MQAYERTGGEEGGRAGNTSQSSMSKQCQSYVAAPSLSAFDTMCSNASKAPTGRYARATERGPLHEHPHITSGSVSGGACPSFTIPNSHSLETRENLEEFKEKTVIVALMKTARFVFALRRKDDSELFLGCQRGHSFTFSSSSHTLTITGSLTSSALTSSRLP